MIEALQFAGIEFLKRELSDQYGIIAFKEDDDYDEDEVRTGLI